MIAGVVLCSTGSFPKPHLYFVPEFGPCRGLRSAAYLELLEAVQFVLDGRFVSTRGTASNPRPSLHQQLSVCTVGFEVDRCDNLVAQEHRHSEISEHPLLHHWRQLSGCEGDGVAWNASRVPSPFRSLRPWASRPVILGPLSP